MGVFIAKVFNAPKFPLLKWASLYTIHKQTAKSNFTNSCVNPALCSSDWPIETRSLLIYCWPITTDGVVMKLDHRVILLCSFLLVGSFSCTRWLDSDATTAAPLDTTTQSLTRQAETEDTMLYLPALPRFERSEGLPQIARVNAPYMEEIRVTRGAIQWFGRVSVDENFADVRIGYTASHLFVHLNVYDRLLWYDTSPTIQGLLQWDAASLFLATPSSNTYRFDGQLSWSEPRSGYQAAWSRAGSGWQLANIPFTTQAGWRGNAPNDTINDDGWSLQFNIPFSSLGLFSPPADASTWKIGLKLYDRDDAAGSPRPSQSWPTQFNEGQPDGWADLVFGWDDDTQLAGLVSSGTTTIRHKLNGAVVRDGMVGGGMLCGEGLNKWSQWGNANYGGAEQVNVQNQVDVSDRPCFSKLYITFPLDHIPSGKTIVSAQVILHQFGNSGGGEWGEPPPSLIQVLTVAEDWEETTLTWNNAPQALENISRTWVDPITVFPGWPGVPHTWDVSTALSQAYHSGEPLRLVFSSADGPMHTGKYFISSDTEDWNEVGRPTLIVNWGEP
jgi:hypothetical protein